MQKTDQPNVSKRFYPFLVASLVLFLVLRFSPVLLELFLNFKPGSLPPTGVFSPSWILAGMVVGFLWLIWLINRYLATLRGWIESNPKRFITAALVVMVCVLAVGKGTFSIYTDERRDVLVANLISQTGATVYTQLEGERKADLTEEEKGSLDWARSLHPVGHYLPAKLVKKKEEAVFWRFFYGAFPLLLLAGMIWLWKPVDKEQIWFIALVGVLVLSSAYFRNYVLIRFSNELVPSMGMSVFFLLLWRAAKGARIPWPVETVMLAVPLFISVSAKYSTVVTWMAVMGAMVVVCLVGRDAKSLRVLLLCAGSGILAIGLHIYIWQETDMLAGHRDNYGVKILKMLGVAPPDWMHPTGSGLEGSTSSIPMLLIGSPVWFGPFVFTGFLAGAWVFLRRGLWRDSLWLFLTVMLVANLLGVMAVNPRAAYLSPAVLPIAVFCALAFRKVLSDQQLRELVFVAYAFVVINVFINSLTS